MLVALLIATAVPFVPLTPSGPPYPGPPLASPERREPNVHLLRTATGQRLTLSMEEYVTGVVAAEMDDAFPFEALAAQAILARTYTLRRVQAGTTLTDDPGRFQAYNPTRITEKIRQAVDRSRGSVIMYKGELVDAVYHACAGGRTAGAAEGMEAPDRAYLRPVADPPCPHDETWTATFSGAEVATAAGVSAPVYSVAIGRKGPSGRALTLVVNGQSVGIFRVFGGLPGLKSTYLTDVAVSGNQVRMSGRGFGHGVGMSQWGAAVLANKGFTAEEIIRHYFSDVNLELYW
jgi:stage II sporulation protein D